jgi:5,10-methylenetetrahydromethanopterin reductase
MIELAARLGDSVTFSVGAHPDRLEGCMAQARAARQAAGLGPMPLGCYVLVSVADTDDVPAARERIRGAVATHTQFSAYHGRALNGMSEGDAQIAQQLQATLREGAKTGHPDRGAKGLLDDDYIDRFAVVGTPDHCAERLGPLVDLGINRMIVITHSRPDPDEQSGRRFGRDVLPLLKSG